MNSTTIDSIITILGIIFLGVIGILGTFYPIKISKLIILGPRLIFPDIFGEENIPEQALRAIELIDDSEEYAAEFGCQLIFIRILGIVSLVMFCGIITTYISSMITR